MDNARDIQKNFIFLYFCWFYHDALFILYIYILKIEFRRHGEKFQMSVQTLMYKDCKMYKIKKKIWGPSLETSETAVTQCLGFPTNFWLYHSKNKTRKNLLCLKLAKIGMM